MYNSPLSPYLCDLSWLYLFMYFFMFAPFLRLFPGLKEQWRLPWKVFTVFWVQGQLATCILFAERARKRMLRKALTSSLGVMSLN